MIRGSLRSKVITTNLIAEYAESTEIDWFFPFILCYLFGEQLQKILELLIYFRGRINGKML